MLFRDITTLCHAVIGGDFPETISRELVSEKKAGIYYSLELDPATGSNGGYVESRYNISYCHRPSGRV